MPRYYNQSEPKYVSAYDPAMDDRLMELQGQEYQKAMAAQAAQATTTAQIGDVQTMDIAGKDQVLNSFNERVSKVKEAYGNDLALAAPALAQVIAKERNNPWFQKNIKYNQEVERKQKLQDQYGPNLLINKDIPELNENRTLNDVNQEDIGFEYINRQHALDLWNKEYGKLATRTRDLGYKDLGNGFIEHSIQKGLSDAEVKELQKTAPAYIQQMLKQFQVSPNPQTEKILSNELQLWQEQLNQGNEAQRTADPFYMAKLRAKLKGTTFTGGDGIPQTWSPVTTKTTVAKEILGVEDYRGLLAKAKTGDSKSLLALDIIKEKFPDDVKAIFNAEPKITTNSSWLHKIPNFKDLDEKTKTNLIIDLEDISELVSGKGYLGYNLTNKGNLLGDVLAKYGLANKRETNYLSGHPNFTFGNKDLDKSIITEFSQAVQNKKDFWNTTYKKVSDKVENLLADENVMSITTESFIPNNATTAKAAKDLIRDALFNNTEETDITNKKGKKANDDFQNLLNKGDITYVSLDKGSELTDNIINVGISTGTGANATVETFKVKINPENELRVFKALAIETDTLVPITALYSKKLYNATKDKKEITIKDIESSGVYNQRFNIDPSDPTNAKITKNDDKSYTFTAYDQETGKTITVPKFQSLGEAADYMMQIYGMIPDYKYDYISEKLRQFSTNKQKATFLKSLIYFGSLYEDEANSFGIDTDEIEEDAY